MASPTFEAGRPGEEAVEVQRVLERALVASRAIDVEALCIMVARAVWQLKVCITVTDHCGNLMDAVCIAAAAALLAHKLPQVFVRRAQSPTRVVAVNTNTWNAPPQVSTGSGIDGSDFVIHPVTQKEPSALVLHHIPLAFSFAILKESDSP
eukprot:888387-Ditylum_brightwellii.AAC.1